MNSYLLKSKTALITGCNRGIGKSILEKFAENGANCIACIRKPNPEFENFCNNLSKKNNVKINIVAFDLLNHNEIIGVIKKIFSITKEIDILVNNAGILFNALFQMTSEKKLKEMFQINFFSQMHLTQLVSREMVKNKKGNIIFISSTSAERNDMGRFAYSSTKAAISSAARVLAKELGNYKIRVNAICPGLTDTDMSKENTREDFLKEEINKISLKRMAEPNEIANVAVFLASDLSSYITGQNIVVDGGV
tara:strand:- start:2695 stop:3447 length:753 start_codon:yes stop_codon:yes gene_type:complete